MNWQLRGIKFQVTFVNNMITCFVRVVFIKDNRQQQSLSDLKSGIALMQT